MASISYLLPLLFSCTAGAAVRVVIPPCDQHAFDGKVDACLSNFNHSLETSGLQDRCAWPAALLFYSQLKDCVDAGAKASKCQSRGSLVDDFFFQVHQVYFSDCGRIQDPPLGTLVLLIAPVTVVPLFVLLLCAYVTPRQASVI